MVLQKTWWYNYTHWCNRASQNMFRIRYRQQGMDKHSDTHQILIIRNNGTRHVLRNCMRMIKIASKWMSNNLIHLNDRIFIMQNSSYTFTFFSSSNFWNCLNIKENNYIYVMTFHKLLQSASYRHAYKFKQHIQRKKLKTKGQVNQIGMFSES